ncbi:MULTISPECIES: sigma-70 family RNA polymerase sigma factor [Pantoea]|uniref:sigma-70 family RNA polymerase sigma factor n=1 Tax=Pantoea TaxID=53335 RepID=UPI000535729E|nr:MULTISPECIES: sigma-70 family RNA polymerase sigma factor [Pantoea]MDT0178333.1 sigma-70 family RNA polymerase sigma factor [Enterobacter sp. BRE11]POW54952.1 RNA polymerase subunit sigma-70 [Pantoea alvi]MBS6438307.1 sigma-70 family RNA polymerase sigma factor [Pantoea sp.]MCG7367406.1 sigma-70 family RNA polymerase sigma factor [Pantoea sp. ACRSH]MCG7397916.1 sigma-70 family RNA polymerase sigma factor [Pantoea sp. ACRSC]
MPATDARAQHWPLLMARAQAGDKAAYNQLLKAMVPAIRALVRKKIADDALVEDVIQETLLAIHRVRHTYDPRRPLLPWVAAIASARAIDALRQRGRQHEVQDEDVLHRQTTETNETDAGEDALNDCLGALPARQRQIVESVHLREQSLAQAAAEANLSLSAVKSLLHRAMLNLRKSGSGKHEKS